MISALQILETQKPYLLYGTAWKKSHTSRLVQEAIESGFRFIDTACQLKHYHEAGVGEGWTLASQKLNLSRKDFYLQTKFTSIDGQDKRLPYDKDASLEDQVRQSFATSLKNLQTDYVDSLVMHGPEDTIGDTMRIWRVFESLVEEGKVHKIGISNLYDLQWLKYLYNEAKVKPSILQNRFYAESDFDTDIRAFCKEKHITYQSFWTLTANRHALAIPSVLDLANQKKLTPQTLMYAYMMTLGHTPLDGTTSKQHMMEDVAVMERMQNGEEILNDKEMKFMAKVLGVPSSNI